MPARPDTRRVDGRGLLAQREHHHHGRYHHLVLALDQHPAEGRSIAIGGAARIEPDQVTKRRAGGVGDGAGDVSGLNLGLRTNGRQRSAGDHKRSRRSDCLQIGELHVCFQEEMRDVTGMANGTSRPAEFLRIYARHSCLTGRHPVSRARPKAPQDLAVRFTGGPHAADPLHRRRSVDEPHRRCRALTMPAVSLPPCV